MRSLEFHFLKLDYNIFKFPISDFKNSFFLSSILLLFIPSFCGQWTRVNFWRASQICVFLVGDFSSSAPTFFLFVIREEISCFFREAGGLVFVMPKREFLAPSYVVRTLNLPCRCGKDQFKYWWEIAFLGSFRLLGGPEESASRYISWLKSLLFSNIFVGWFLIYSTTFSSRVPIF